MASSYNGAGVTNSVAGDLAHCKIWAGANSTASPRSLVALYQFNEGAGTTLTDDAPNGDDGTITNATWVNRSPGLVLPANSARILQPDQDCRNALWLLTAAASHGTVVVGQGNAANPVKHER